jgi:hypothetical protein
LRGFRMRKWEHAKLEVDWFRKILRPSRSAKLA